jgi:hypothetical protein
MYSLARRAQRRAAATSPEARRQSRAPSHTFSLTDQPLVFANESARLWASYQNIDYLDFRVYRVKDPNKFFKQLDDPHEMGEEKEKADLAGLRREFHCSNVRIV